jgi:hypothetical protein
MSQSRGTLATQSDKSRLSQGLGPQVPLTQLAVPQLAPQRPQLAGSVLRSVHLPEQLVVPAGHLHMPLTQAVPAGHAVPQVPQLFESVAGLMQAPLQHRQPAGQTRPQPPQLDPSCWKLTQLPAQQSGRTPLQHPTVKFLYSQLCSPRSQHASWHWRWQLVSHGSHSLVHSFSCAGPPSARMPPPSRSELTAPGFSASGPSVAALIVTSWVGRLTRRATVSFSSRGIVSISADLRPRRPAGIDQS